MRRHADCTLIWYVEARLSNALRLETYIEDATCESDSELAVLFRKAQAYSVREPRWASRCCVPGSPPDASRPSCGVPLPARPRVAVAWWREQAASEAVDRPHADRR